MLVNFGLRRTTGKPLAQKVAALFSAGEQGAWYDPSDFSTMFQDAAGTTPVTAVGQAVGRILDKSGRGNHATQSTSTSRPVLSARYNLNIATEDFTQASWNKGRITAQSNITGPDGGNSACAFYETTDFGSHYIDNAIQTPSGVRTKRSAFLKYSGAQYVLVTSNPDVADRNICVDLINNTIAAQGSLVNSASITPYKNGWYFVQFEVTAGTTFTICFRTLQSVSTGSQQFAGNPSRGVMVYRPDTRVANDGIGLPPYQRINTVNDYDTTGFPPYLLFDGIDDALQTGNIDFTGTDKVTVWAGVRKLSDAASGVLMELSNNSSTNTGVFAMFSPGNVGATYLWRSRGTATGEVIKEGFSSPITNVLSATGYISGDFVDLRANGTKIASNAADQGAGNYGNYPLYIGSRSGTSIPFNGRLYSLIIRGAQSTDTQISTAETYVNSKAGAY